MAGSVGWLPNKYGTRYKNKYKNKSINIGDHNYKTCHKKRYFCLPTHLHKQTHTHTHTKFKKYFTQQKVRAKFCMKKKTKFIRQKQIQ